MANKTKNKTNKVSWNIKQHNTCFNFVFILLKINLFLFSKF